MKKLSSLKKLSLAAMAIAGSLSAVSTVQAATITGEFTADNHMMMMVRYGPNDVQSILPTNQNDGWAWKHARQVKFDLRKMNRRQLKACSVNIVAWGDRSGSGLGGWLQNTSNPSKLVYTGQGKIRYLPPSASSISNNNTPSPAVLNNLMAAGGYAMPAPKSTNRIGVQAPWGNAVQWALPLPAQIQQNINSYKWIWSYPNLSSGDNKYASFSIPCRQLTKPTITRPPKPDWVDVPGDHFQCYQVRQEDKLRPVTITTKDQFGKSKLTIAQPRLLCNPAEKNHRGKTYKVRNPKRHLVCYDVKSRSDAKRVRVETKNQFGTHRLTAQRPALFCAPSLKKHI